MESSDYLSATYAFHIDELFLIYMNIFFISDILFLIVVVPFTAYKYSALYWPFGEIWCKAMKYCLYVSCYVTVYTLVAVAMQRFLIIVYSRGHDMWRRPKNVFLMIIFIWGAVLIGNIWKWNIHTVKTLERVDVTYCGVIEPAISPLFLTYFVFGYVVPLILVSIFYFLIVMYLRRAPVVTTGNEWKSVDTAPGEQCNNNTTQALTNNNDTSNTGASRRQRKRKRVCRVLIVVILTFAISWLPLHVSLMCGQFWAMPKSTFYEVLRVLWHCMAYSNSCANPIIYNYASREFRKHFAAMFCRAKTQVRTSTSGATAAASTRVGSDGMPVPPFSEATELSRMKTAMETHL